MDPLVHDIGMNNGDDCAHYLAAGYKVVAIDAKPELCGNVRARFDRQISEQRLTVARPSMSIMTTIVSGTSMAMRFG